MNFTGWRCGIYGIALEAGGPTHTIQETVCIAEIGLVPFRMGKVATLTGTIYLVAYDV